VIGFFMEHKSMFVYRRLASEIAILFACNFRQSFFQFFNLSKSIIVRCTNAGSGSISSYKIAHDGSLSLLNATAGLTGAGSSPVDMAFSNNGSYLYALANGAHTITMFQMGADVSLNNLGPMSVPVGVTGLAAQ
jgi:6-phosphogluconolactonase (cycloisomerase 2 family)